MPTAQVHEGGSRRAEAGWNGLVEFAALATPPEPNGAATGGRAAGTPEAAVTAAAAAPAIALPSSGGQTAGAAGHSGVRVPVVVSVTSGVNSGGGSGNGKPALERPDPSGDDIVARRLRRAAEEEKDPELRRKLWQEYVNYKKNTQTP